MPTSSRNKTWGKRDLLDFPRPLFTLALRTLARTQDGRAEQLTDDVVRPEHRHNRRILDGTQLRRLHCDSELFCGMLLCVGVDQGGGGGAMDGVD